MQQPESPGRWVLKGPAPVACTPCEEQDGERAGAQSGGKPAAPPWGITLPGRNKRGDSFHECPTALFNRQEFPH